MDTTTTKKRMNRMVFMLLLATLIGKGLQAQQALCLGEIKTLYGPSGVILGTWSSTDSNIVSVDTNGQIEAQATGTASVNFTESNGSVWTYPYCVVDPANPGEIFGDSVLCLQVSEQYDYPNCGGTWSVSDTSIAKITSNGIVHGVAPGNVNIIYTITTAACTVTVSKTVEILNYQPVRLYLESAPGTDDQILEVDYARTTKDTTFYDPLIPIEYRIHPKSNDVTFCDGSLPPGVNAVFTDSSVIISGTPYLTYSPYDTVVYIYELCPPEDSVRCGNETDSLHYRGRIRLLPLDPLIVPLPVSLKQFTVKAEAKQFRIEWQTASEHNAQHFRLEKSTDGEQFHTLALLEAAGTVSELSHYAVRDEQSAADKMVYYRLILVDLDGEQNELGLIAAQAKATMQIYPNPTAEYLFVSGIEDRNAQPQIIDVHGRLLATPATLLNENKWMFDLRSLSSGSYFLKTEEGIWPIVKGNN